MSLSYVLPCIIKSDMFMVFVQFKFCSVLFSLHSPDFSLYCSYCSYLPNLCQQIALTKCYFAAQIINENIKNSLPMIIFRSFCC